jgi:hypothetical protein
MLANRIIVVALLGALAMWLAWSGGLIRQAAGQAPECPCWTADGLVADLGGEECTHARSISPAFGEIVDILFNNTPEPVAILFFQPQIRNTPGACPEKLDFQEYAACLSALVQAAAEAGCTPTVAVNISQ